jgi:glutamyl-tRNA reductase
VLDAETVERSRGGRQLLFVDLAVPRDLDPAIHELDGCYLFDIDDLQAIVSETLAGRRSEAERAEAIVAGEAEKFHEWQASLDVVPAIMSLRAHAEEIREAELRKAEGMLGRLDDTERQARVDHRTDRQQAPASADRADEAGGCVRRRRDLC